MNFNSHVVKKLYNVNNNRKIQWEKVTFLVFFYNTILHGYNTLFNYYVKAEITTKNKNHRLFLQNRKFEQCFRFSNFIPQKPKKSNISKGNEYYSKKSALSV